MVVGWAPRWTSQTERTSLLTLGAATVAAQIAPGVFVGIEGVVGASQARLEVSQQGVDPAELLQVV